VADQQLDRLLGTLEASFQGAVDHAEELAAADLATSLLQGRDVFDVLRAWGRATIEQADGRSTPVSEVGADYVGVYRPCREVVRLESAVLRRGDGPRLVCDRDRTFLQILREWARCSEEVVVGTDEGGFRGGLVAVGSDHLLIETVIGQRLVGAAKVRSVKLSRGR
jgi:hypothetical protein